jgi:hypothetical protein
MGLAVVLLLVPHAWRQLCSSFVDMEMALFLLAAAYYASRSELRREDLALASLAMGLAAASKTTWLVFVPPIALVAWLRYAARHRAEGVRAIALAVGASLLVILALGLPCHVRNWIVYGNPLWPIGYDIPSLGLHLPGIFSVQDYLRPDPPVTDGFDVPRGGMRDVMHIGYGMAFMWVAAPLGCAALAAWAAGIVRGARTRKLEEGITAITPIILMGLTWLALGPNFRQPRYNLHFIGVVLVVGAWFLRDAAWQRLREGALGAMLVLSLVPLFWMRDANFATVEEEVERLSHPFASRAYSEHPTFDLLEKEKERELHAGDDVVYSEGVAFPGILWNFHFSNRVEYVEFTNPRDFLDQIAVRNPRWVCVGQSGNARKTLERTGEWVVVGETNPGGRELAYRRKGG